MLIILPPSETKAHGGSGTPVTWEDLSFEALNPIRQEIAQALSSLDVNEALGVLGISEKLRAEAESNRNFFSSPTMAAIERFTGVLFDALGAETLPGAARARLVIGDALFGLVAAGDMIPHYRLSGSTKLEGRTMKSRWGTEIRAQLERLEASGELIIDLRSGTYQQLGPLPSAVTVRVESVQPDGSRKVVSHFNKHYKGLLARALALSDCDASTVSEVAERARTAGFTIEESERSGTELIMVVNS